MTAERAPLVLVYDRCAFRNRRELDMRLTGCRSYADSRGWVLTGHWLDLGEHALGSSRPRLRALIETVRIEAPRREVLCLVHNWGRLSNDVPERLEMQRRIAEAGGWTETTFQESDQSHPLFLGARP